MALDSSPAMSSTPGTPPADARQVVLQARRLMGTDVSVQIAVEPAHVADAEQAAAAALDWLAEVDARLSRFRPDSELSLMNRSPDTWFTASDLTYAAVERAVEAARATGGLFDPTLLASIEALGYDRDFSELVVGPSPTSPVQIQNPSRVSDSPGPHLGGAWRAIQLDPARRRIRLPAGTALDLGGIAKGWAADVALEQFCAPFPGALVNVGGDLRLQGGPQPGEAWSIGIRDPRHEGPEGVLAEAPAVEYRAVVTFSRGGLATSGAVRRWWWRGGERVHHLLDPRTGRPLPLWLGPETAATNGTATAGSAPPVEIATVTALAPTGTRAEVATKVALLRGLPAALHAVERAWERWGAVAIDDAGAANPDLGVALVVLLANGDLLCSENLNAWLASWGTAGASLPTRFVPPPYASVPRPYAEG